MNKYYSVRNRTTYFPGQCFSGKHQDKVARVIGLTKGMLTGVFVIIEVVTEKNDTFNVNVKQILADELKYQKKDIISEDDFLKAIKGSKLSIDMEQSVKIIKPAADSSSALNKSEDVVAMKELVAENNLKLSVLENTIAAVSMKIDNEQAVRGIKDEYHEMSEKLDSISKLYDDMVHKFKSAAEAL